MGLIKAAAGAVGSAFADQWKELFYCEAMEAGVLMKKGVCRVGEKSSNTRRDTNIITDGSVIDVNEGQCLLVVEDGAVVDFCAQPGQYRYQTGTQPSLLAEEGLDFGRFVQEVKQRFTFGGQAAHDQRIYFVNTREIPGQKIGLGGVPFRDGEFNFTIRLQGYGSYTFRITNPLCFYKNVCANAQDEAALGQFGEQMRAELQRATLPVFARLSEKHIPYDRLTAHTAELCDYLQEELSEEWSEARGISICSIAFAAIVPDAESAKKISQMQESRVYTDTELLGARMGAAQANAMESAAENSAGAVTGFVGMNAMGAGGSVAQLLHTVAENAQKAQRDATWACACGAVNTTQFCPTCGQKRAAESWTCSCGTVNITNFCGECGKKRPQ